MEAGATMRISATTRRKRKLSESTSAMSGLEIGSRVSANSAHIPTPSRMTDRMVTRRRFKGVVFPYVFDVRPQWYHYGTRSSMIYYKEIA
jgi:hypothetical protein